LYNTHLDSYVNFSTKNPVWYDKKLEVDENVKPPYPEADIRSISIAAKRFEAYLSRY